MESVLATSAASATPSPLHVAIVIPYREQSGQHRQAQLHRCIEHLNEFRQRHFEEDRVQWSVVVAVQVNDGLKFNRGGLLNRGMLYATQHLKAQYIILHDVDILPSEELAPMYAHAGYEVACSHKIVHLAACWKRYPSEHYLGGAVGVTTDLFQRVNGYPNNYWGWGGEDDELQRRCTATRTRVHRVEKGSYEDLEQMNLTEKLTLLKSHPEWKNQKKWELKDAHAATWQTNGLSNLDECSQVEHVSALHAKCCPHLLTTYFVQVRFLNNK